MSERSLDDEQGPTLLGNPCDSAYYSSYLEQHIVRHAAQECRFAHPPIETTHVFAKDSSVDGQFWRQGNLELVALHLAGDGTCVGNRRSQIEIS